MGTLERYRDLLRRNDEVIRRGGWHEARKPLVREMDALWDRLSAREREAALACSRELYEARLGATG